MNEKGNRSIDYKKNRENIIKDIKLVFVATTRFNDSMMMIHTINLISSPYFLTHKHTHLSFYLSKVIIIIIIERNR